MTTPSITEIIARAIAEPMLREPGWSMPDAQRIVAALEAAGFVIVPKKPTLQQLMAAPSSFISLSHGDHAANIYRAMIQAGKAKG